MIKNERRDYRIAILGSLVFHLVLFLIYFPNALSRQEMNLKTYPVGMVNLSNGSGGFDIEEPVETKVFDKTTPKTVIKPEDKPIDSKPAPKIPETPKTKPADQSIVAAGEPESAGKPITPVPDGNKGGTSGPAGETSGPGDSPKPRGLGDGEGKVFRLGALPPYPKNALNEGVQGEVGIRILVFGNGGLEKIELLNSSGDSRLDKAALRAVNAWQFQPESGDYSIDIIFSFELKNGVSIRFIKAETRP